MPSWLLNKVPLVKKFIEIEAWARQRARARISLGTQGKDGRSDFFSQLLSPPRQGDDPMTEEEILANALVLLNRNAYDVLSEEVRGRFQDESDMDFRNCATLPFLIACIQESMRLYPAAPEIPPRVSPGDVIDGREVPAGTLITVFLTATNRSCRYFSEPDIFRPERWLPKTHALYDAKFRHDDLSIVKPFSYGPRDCIGKSLRLHEMRLVVARLLFRFDFEMLPGQERWQSGQRVFLLWEKPPLYVRFRPRGT
ncbi:hypothetical protein CP533_1130 [Ophiocordyceps camponoti-saundersi (nom. inval.)]|nr:hypothetical protein CP533_1130 [Ophiocordyceps camponoti-saundersi (nom. inval.)]